MNRLPPLNAVRVFAVVARELNMSRAAEKLHVTQSAISRQISQLEDFIGLPLFVRRSRGIELTAVGRQLLPAVENAFEGINRAISRLAPRPTELRIRMPPTFAMRWFLPRLADFQRRQPGIDVRISTGDCSRVQLELEDLDAVILANLSGAEYPHAMPLFAENLTPVCSPATAMRLRTPADLTQETLIHLSADHADWRKWLALASVNHPALDAGPSFEVIDMAVNLAGQGLGVAIADPVLLSDDLACGRVVAPFPALAVQTGYRYWFVCPKSRQAESQLAALREWLRVEIDATMARLGTDQGDVAYPQASIEH